MTDLDLLKAFANHRDAAAFRELVARHMDWVYSSARRQVRDAHLAEDVAQAVFVLLAQKAPHIAARVNLAGWLFRATRYCAANALKQQGRRRHHEKEAAIMQREEQRVVSGDMESDWSDVAPVIDEAIGRLSASDRDAVLMRFYQGRSVIEIAGALSVSEEAAKKRVQRALVKLRELLARRGVTASAAGLTTTIAANVSQASPVGLIETASAAAIGAGAAKGTLAGLIVKGATKAMLWAQVKVAAAVVLAGTVAAGAGYAVATARSPAASQPVSSRITRQAAMLSTQPSTEFDSLYEKAPASAPDLTMNVGPNTFSVIGVLRYGPDGLPLVQDGKGSDQISLMGPELAKPNPNKDQVFIYLKPEPQRYDIDRLRVFDHMTRRYISGVSVAQLLGTSILQIVSPPGTLPDQIDLWLDTASYAEDNKPSSLEPRINASVTTPSGATVAIRDLRDGSWAFSNDHFTTINAGSEGRETSVHLKTTGAAGAGRHQIAAIAKSGQKYLSDFFLDLSQGGERIYTFPFPPSEILLLEVRPMGLQPPFYFDGVRLPPVAGVPGGKPSILEPVIVPAGGQSRVTLPCGAIVELSGICYHPSKGRKWWRIDGKPVAAPRFRSDGSVTDQDGTRLVREFSARLIKMPPGQRSAYLQWEFVPGASSASGSDGKSSHITAALHADKPIVLQLGVPTSPWQTLEEIAIQKLPAEAECWWSQLGKIRETSEGLTLEARVMDMPSSLRMVLIDAAGKVHTHSGYSSYASSDKLAPWGVAKVEYQFKKVKAAEVRSIRFEGRREEYAQFDNLPVEPKE